MSLFNSLQTAVSDLQQRGLVLAARWAAEAAQGMETPGEPLSSFPGLPIQTLVGKSYFDCHEYDRCWYNLKNSQEKIGRFLCYYSRYLAGEKLREDKPFESKTTKTNPYLSDIYESIKESNDPFMLYLQGIILRRTNQEDMAVKVLSRSCCEYPFNWSCWQELLMCFRTLNDCVETVSQATSEVAHFDVMYTFFLLHAKQEFYQPKDSADNALAKLKKVFPNFLFLDSQSALLHIHNVEYEAAEQIFEKIISVDPYRLEDLDIYSNLLYVTEQRPKLALIAQEVVKTDKYRAEACCVVANYYSLRGEHEQAVEYYKRALISNPNYLSAWTLLGHEFVELKNTHAAIESYTTAVNICKRDFRAWYGLGQAYEVLDMASYAHYYYQRALALSPGDSRIWSALANCYEKMRDFEQSVRTYELALKVCKCDSYFFFRLGHLYDDKKEYKKAQVYYELCISYDEDDDEDEVKPQARLWLARNAARSQKWAEALEHANAIVNAKFNSGLEEDARVIVRDAMYHVNRSGQDT